MTAPKTVDELLRSVSYEPDSSYVPSEFAIEFVNFIKLVNGTEGEENKTPLIHYKMLDTLDSDAKQIANMLFRGAAKTTIFGEYLMLYLATFGKLPNFGTAWVRGEFLSLYMRMRMYRYKACHYLQALQLLQALQAMWSILVG